eukprot:gene5255-5919_t
MKKPKKPSASAELIALKDFPHHEEVGKKYFLQKPRHVSNLLANPRHLCCEDERDGPRPVSVTFRIAATLFAITALLISLVKDLFDKESSLALGIVELVLALLAVSITLIHHGLTWKGLKNQLAKLEHAHPEELEQTQASKNQRPSKFLIWLICIWLFCCLLLLIGFLVFHLLDRSEHSFLRYTKFSTALTVFLSWILDSVVRDALQKVSKSFMIDQYILLIHGLKEELYCELRKHGKKARVDDIEKYLQSQSMLNIDGHRITASETKFVGQTTEACDDEPMEEDDEYDEDADVDLISVVKQLDEPVGEKVLKVNFKESKKVKNKKRENESEGILSTKKEVYESNDAFVVVEMDEVEGKQLLDDAEPADI